MKKKIREMARLMREKSKQVPEHFTGPWYARWQRKTTSQEIRKFSLEDLEDNEKQLKALKQELRQLNEEIVEDLRKAGNAHYINYDFKKALDSYQKALTYIYKNSNPTLWASLLIEIGNVNGEIAIRAKGEDIRVHFQNSINAYLQAQEVYSRKNFPQHWARTQMNLGLALADQEHPRLRR
ncbi:MAG: hypothetical protein R3B74_15270 [Nitrospirales bacterium]|nr:hypothetical protein [Nitrospirales bacterium]